jgi:hypothetical protein
MNRNNRIWIPCEMCGQLFAMPKSTYRSYIKRVGRPPARCRAMCDGTPRVKH